MTHFPLIKPATFSLIFMVLSLYACSSRQHPPISTLNIAPSLNQDAAVMADGYRLPINAFYADNPKAAAIALHGFNDYRNAFTPLCRYLSERNIHCYAYDQRGFGETEYRGLWPNDGVLQNDLATMTELIKKKHPTLPIYIIGESMGGAVAMTTFANSNAPDVAGISLLAPAVWAPHTQPWYYRAALWLMVRIAPGWKPESKRFSVTVSDNNEMLKALSTDPLTIKETRVDTVSGLIHLMDQAFTSAKDISTKGIIFYGDKDELITKLATCGMLKNIARNKHDWHFVVYENGYHMLSRDLQAENVYQDLIAWISDDDQPPAEELSVSDAEPGNFYCDV